MSTPRHNDLLYDGDCPLCASYVRRLRVRTESGPLALHDARAGGPLVDQVMGGGYDLDRGPVLIEGGSIHTGPDCLQRLARMSARSNWLSRMHARVFGRPRVARFLHPWLRRVRLATLSLLGRRSFADAAFHEKVPASRIAPPRS